MKLNEAMTDLEFISRLNGKKLLIKGNHDYWWSSISKLNSLFENMSFIQNTHYAYEDYAICGTRGWVAIDGTEEHDEKVYNREILRLKMSLEGAAKAGFKKIIVMMHYPPVTRISRSQEFLDILSQYNVEKLIYGHIHYDSKDICINGIYNGIEYLCTSADIINFSPVRIL
jgi:predicted phosphohydrolase